MTIFIYNIFNKRILMKDKIYSLYYKFKRKMFNKFHYQISIIFKGTPINPNKNIVFLIPPTDGGSLGDEAMIAASVNYLINNNKRVYIITSDRSLKKNLTIYNIDCDYIYISRLYDGFTPFLSFRKSLKEFRPESVYLIGADVMDGFYSKVRSLTRLSLLDIASSYIKDVRLLGFSMNENPEPSTIKYMSKIDHRITFLSRDPVSSERLTQNGIKNKLVADLAFGLKPNKNFYLDNLAAPDWVKKFGPDGYICLNLNAIHLNKYGEEYFIKVCNVINKIIETANKHVLFVSHDTRAFNKVTDQSFAKMVAESLNLRLNTDYTIAPETLNAENLKYLASQAAFIVSGRMHFAIGALGAGVPSLMFGYQGKQEGLVKHFDISPDLLILDPSSKSSDMVTKTERFIRDLTDIKLKILSRTNEVTVLSRENFTNFKQ